MDNYSEVFAQSAHIVARSKSTEQDLLDLVKARVSDPTILDEHPPYIFEAEISNTNTDSYYTWMHTGSLRNFTDDANEGVAFLTSHDSRELPLGSSLAAKYIAGKGTTTPRVNATFYTLKGLHTNKVSSDEFIKGVRASIISDVSIGFYNAEFKCDLCEKDLFS